MSTGNKLVTNDVLKEVIHQIRYNEDFEGGVGYYIQSPSGNKFKLCVKDNGELFAKLIEDSNGVLYE